VGFIKIISNSLSRRRGAILRKIMKICFGNLINEDELCRKKKQILGLVCCLLALICGCIWYLPGHEKVGKIVFILSWPFIKNVPFPARTEFVFPGLMNGLWGLFFTTPIYLRRFIPFRNLSIYSCLSFSLNWLLFAVLAQLILGKSGVPSNSIMHILLMAGMLLSWLGMRSVAGFSWIGVVILGVFNLIRADIHLQWWGFFFLLFAVFSLLFQTEVSPLDFLSGFIEDFKGKSHSQAAEVIKDSISAAKETTSKYISKR